MKVIDRYILQRFFWAFVVFFCSLTGLYIMIDAFNNVTEFMARGEKQGGLLVVIAQYYAPRSLFFFNRTAGILILISAMFTVAWMTRHNEMMALMAAGVPKARIVRPIIMAGALLIMLAVLNRELLIPPLRSELSYNAQDLLDNRLRPLSGRYDNETGIFLSGKGVWVRKRQIEAPNFILPRKLAAYGEQLTADMAEYLPARDGRPAGYLLNNVRQPKGLADRPSLLIDSRRVVITPLDANWLKPDQCFVFSAVSFDQLSGGKFWRRYSSTADLISGLHNDSNDFGAGVRVEVHSRFVRPLLDMTLLFLGLPLVLSGANRNIFVAAGIAVFLVVVFMLVTFACQFLGSNYWIAPSLAAWLPLFIFVPAAAAMSGPLRE